MIETQILPSKMACAMSKTGLRSLEQLTTFAPHSSSKPSRTHLGNAFMESPPPNVSDLCIGLVEHLCYCFEFGGRDVRHGGLEDSSQLLVLKARLRVEVVRKNQKRSSATLRVSVDHR